MIPGDIKLQDLMCGHDGKYICSIRQKYDHRRSKEPIQLFRLECDCWIVLDGNNRIGSILKQFPNAIISNFPIHIFLEVTADAYDPREILYWVPYPKPFKYIMPISHEMNKIRVNKRKYSSVIDYNNSINKLDNLLRSEIHYCNKGNVQQGDAPELPFRWHGDL